jgi:hypothetical protein
MGDLRGHLIRPAAGLESLAIVVLSVFVKLFGEFREQEA